VRDKRKSRCWGDLSDLFSDDQGEKRCADTSKRRIAASVPLCDQFLMIRMAAEAERSQTRSEILRFELSGGVSTMFPLRAASLTYLTARSKKAVAVVKNQNSCSSSMKLVAKNETR